MRNGFFQVGCTPNGTILKLFKPRGEGEMVSAKEIADYLSSNSVLFTAAAISQGIDDLMCSSGKNEKLILLNRDYVSEIRESYVLRVSPDKMKLTARFYPPSMRGGKMSCDEFLNDLAVKKITTGINEELIRAFFLKPEFCKDIVVAEGIEPKQGEHAWIEYFFDTDINRKPALNEDGTVDFFNLNTYVQATKGDILARLHREVKGEPGMTVFGEPVRALEVKRKVLKYGRNITLSEDGETITADVSGNVSLIDEKVFLSDVMELDNVGTASGNIDYDGSVRVLGNVMENFSVKATGTVEVRGVVEGAFIEAGEDIIIARGMKGMDKGEIKAGRNIIAKFFENANVTAEGYVETESILHSTVMSGSDVVVTGKHGFITGGRVAAKNLVRVKTLGSDMGADTIIEVGAPPRAKVRYQELQRKIAETTKAIESAKPQLLNFAKKVKNGDTLSLDQKNYFKTLRADDATRKANIEAWTTEMDELNEILEKSTESAVEVTGDVYEGTKICISDSTMVVKSTMTYCRFRRIDGDVKMTAL